MTHYPYLIIGGGMTADAAARGIRDIDHDNAIGLISAENHPPYNRPPLSKGLWTGKPVDGIWRDTEALGVTMHLGRTAKILDPERKTVTDDAGERYGFDTLLLATGGSPRTLFPEDDVTIYFRTFADYQRLRELTEHGTRFAVIGGGFIGSEIAAALAVNGHHVSMILRGPAIGSRLFPRDLAAFLDDYYREQGVSLRTGETVTQVLRKNGRAAIHTRGGEAFEVDGVIAGLGLIPNVGLAREAGLVCGDGIHVDEYLRSSHPAVFAAGDVASFYQPALGRRLRFEHEDNANTMGLHAGRAMAGRLEPFQHLPFFYSDLFDLGYEAVGILDSRLETSSEWHEPYREGSVYYRERDRIRGVLRWNLWGQLEAAKSLIAGAESGAPGDLAGSLPA